MRRALSGWISRFGFGHDTGIDFPGESPGIVLPRSKWYGSAVGTIPIGQGIAVTPVQVAAAYAAIANGGVWMTPHLVDHVIGGSRPKVVHRRIVSPAIAKQLMAMLVDVVAEGTGTLAHVPGYVVAGKTGTANKPDPQTGGYSTSKYVASFVGHRAGDVAPARDPRDRGRAAGRDLRRHGRGAGLPADRALRAPVPRSAAGQPVRSGRRRDDRRDGDCLDRHVLYRHGFDGHVRFERGHAEHVPFVRRLGTPPPPRCEHNRGDGGPPVSFAQKSRI